MLPAAEGETLQAGWLATLEEAAALAGRVNSAVDVVSAAAPAVDVVSEVAAGGWESIRR